MSYPFVILPMQGLGDSIYQRPFVKWWARRKPTVYLATSWPEVFFDIPNVVFTEPSGVELRTQVKNMQRQAPGRFVRPPLQAERIRPTYNLQQGETIYAELRRTMKVRGSASPAMSLPDFGKSSVRFKRYAVVRPVTLRKEWLNPARSPDPRYIARAVELLRDQGYRIVSVADVDGHDEWIEGPEYEADRAFHAGELETPELLALCRGAALIVGGVGWIVPHAMATGVPTVVIGGGNGAHNAPEIVTDPSQDTSRIGFVLPDQYCRCTKRFHACPKDISEFDARFLAEVGAVTGQPVEVAA